MQYFCLNYSLINIKKIKMISYREKERHYEKIISLFVTIYYDIDDEYYGLWRASWWECDSGE